MSLPLRRILPGLAVGLALGLAGLLVAMPGPGQEREGVVLQQGRAIGELRGELARLATERAEREEDWRRSRAKVAALQAELVSLATRNSALREELTGTVTELLAGTEARHEQIAGDLAGLRASIQAQSAALARVHERTRGDDPAEARSRLRQDVLAPVLQITGEEAVGSAVLVHGGEDQRGPHYYALSSLHVVRDIHGQELTIEQLAELGIETVLERGGTDLRLQSFLVAADEATDLALLRIDTQRALEPVARIAPRARVDQVKSFTPVYTVGCPLGTAAQATRGEITRESWEIGGQEFWMVSSPAYFGNSGGGVFLADSRELIGVFAKIYTHGNFRPQVVTHMGLAVPLDTLHDWLESSGYGHILSPAAARSRETARQD